MVADGRFEEGGSSVIGKRTMGSVTDSLCNSIGSCYSC